MNYMALKIITHGGQAHADELLAIAFILIKENCPIADAEIVRVNDGKASDWADAKYVIDVGKQYDPDKGWFDHHQFPSDAPADCAFTLVAKHFGLARNAFPWIERVALLDSKGPFVWFEETFDREAKGMPEINEALGPDVFSYFVRKANASHKNPNSFKEGLAYFIDWLRGELDYLDNREKNIEFARSNLQIIDMGSWKIAYFNQKEMRGVSELCDELSEKDPAIIVSSKLDDRGDGFSATRWNNSGRVDFKPRQGEPDCVFAHENGFCLKWKNNWQSFIDALLMSVVD